MSGHSKWAQIKHKKAITDTRKAKVFSKISKLITLAAREKGADVSTNPGLRVAVEKARAVNMPHDNIERAIKRGSGQLDDGIVYDLVTYEGFAPHQVPIIVECLTENRNRTAADIRVLGVLLEKQQTTPEYYPMSLKAVVAACNQTTNREPIVAYSESTVERCTS